MESDTLTTMLVSPLILTMACCLPVAILGTILGLTDRLTVFYGSEDVVLTCFGYASILATLVASTISEPVAIIMLCVTALLVLSSLATSRKGNRSFFKACIAVPTKFMLIFIIVLLGILAFESLKSALGELNKGRYEAALKNAAVGTGALAGSTFIIRLVRKLVKARDAKAA